ncbi:MAG TPA: hypothetical protein ENK23_00075, partial [Sorangium sp.]|nr:hypothetical protein [Sorangium sp.]
MGYLSRITNRDPHAAPLPSQRLRSPLARFDQRLHDPSLGDIPIDSAPLSDDDEFTAPPAPHSPRAI